MADKHLAQSQSPFDRGTCRTRLLSGKSTTRTRLNPLSIGERVELQTMAQYRSALCLNPLSSGERVELMAIISRAATDGLNPLSIGERVEPTTLTR